jgi:hypothetical protein
MLQCDTPAQDGIIAKIRGKCRESDSKVFDSIFVERKKEERWRIHVQ